MKIQYIGEPVEVPDEVGAKILLDQENCRIENITTTNTHFVRLNGWSYDVKFEVNVEEVK